MIDEVTYYNRALSPTEIQDIYVAGSAGKCVPRPSLGLQFSAGQPILTITGTIGTVYSIQYASDLSPTNHLG